ncbi:tetratricopeptide repeat protein [Sphingobium sp. AN558]|uniref:tetratricopeptide repeat protein n=1 Tax=Sphingobium sp. AN558 TaxID=3133442 RepID=UPI0030C5E9E3
MVVKRFPLWMLASLLLASGGAQAQSDQAQLVLPSGATDLNVHLARLAANPRDVSALIGAGEAALALDDPRAAAGFFARADAIESGNGRIKAGLGRVMLQMQNPAEALRLFDQAGRLGYPDATILSDRGLARDMAGDQAGAQRDYVAALRSRPNDAELVRRYAASLGISGQVDAAERLLQPLLYKSDRAAWRYRAFILAMNNKQVEAKKIAEQTMPAQLAAAITPYMQKMPYLTAGQKAAAVHFGHFPATIGTTIAAITPTPAAPGAPAIEIRPTQVAQATPKATARSDWRTRREEQRQAREAKAAARAATRLAAASPPVRPAPVQPRVAPAVPVPPAAPIRQPIVTPVPAQTSPSAAGYTASAIPRPSPAPAQPVAISPPSAPVERASAPVRAEPQVRPMQGPPAPGFESVETAAAPLPAQQGTPPSAASQINAITLAQASAPVPTPVAPVQPVSVAPPVAGPVASPVTGSISAPATGPAASAVISSTPQPNPAATRSLADIIRAIDVPEAERQPSAGAVDLAELDALQAARRTGRQVAADRIKKAAAAKAKAEADAKAKKLAEEKARLAANPARSWLQIGTGANRGALGFTLKTMRRKYESIAPQDGWMASWGRTNRLLVGPFTSFARARTLEAKLKDAGADVFAWQSDAGEVVERLGGQ